MPAAERAAPQPEAASRQQQEGEPPPSSPAAVASITAAAAPAPEAASTPKPAAPAVETQRPARSTRVLDPATAPQGRRSAFTTVKDGETLEEVSMRVYGTTDEVELLWKANRDVLPRRNASLAAGLVLRTPAP